MKDKPYEKKKVNYTAYLSSELVRNIEAKSNKQFNYFHVL